MKPVVFGILMTLLVCIGLGWLWYSQQTLPTTPDVAVANQASTPQPDPEKQIHPIIRDLPPTGATPKTSSNTTEIASVESKLPQLVSPPTDLGQSDEQTRAALTDLSTQTEITTSILQWLTPKEQIRKWVLLVDNVAMGKVPVKNRPLEFAIPPFAVNGGENQPSMSEKNFSRLDPLVDAFVSLEPDLLARYYQAWDPILQEAYNELGQPGSFRSRLLGAIDRVLAVTPLEEPAIALSRPSVFFRYADPEQEAASDLEKLLWRMGPKSTVRIQSHLWDVKLALNSAH